MIIENRLLVCLTTYNVVLLADMQMLRQECTVMISIFPLGHYIAECASKVEADQVANRS